MKRRFQTIGISAKNRTPHTLETVHRVADFLIKRGRDVIIDKSIPENPDLPCQQLTIEQLGQQSELIIIVGGDGTLLNAARTFVDFNVPLLGINLGRLGFLVDVSPDEIDELDNILNGYYIEDNRMLLDVQIMQGKKVLRRGHALNDAVLYKWNTARMVEFAIYIDGQLLNAHRSDGLIISTPTGSTAYALSGGGPIVHPEIDAFLLVPICPHTLSNRPFMISANSKIEIRMQPESISYCRISCDGQYDLEIDQEVTIQITKLPNKIRLIHPANHDFFEILRAKLRWGDNAHFKDLC